MSWKYNQYPLQFLKLSLEVCSAPVTDLSTLIFACTSLHMQLKLRVSAQNLGYCC